MKSEKGVTITSLIIYVGVLLVVVLLVGRITVFLYRNSKNINNSVAESSYNKLNLYFLEETKKENTFISNMGSMEKKNEEYIFTRDVKDSSNNYTAIQFCTEIDSNDEEYNTIGLIDDGIYYNKAKICSDVDKFSITKDNNKITIKIKYKDNNKEYTTSYNMRTKTEN